jgi:hypothetical protein
MGGPEDAERSLDQINSQERMAKFPAGSLPWTRILAEFVAITVAVYLGLLADNYREHRSDKARESEYLVQLAADLDSDMDALQYTRQRIHDQASAAELIHRAVGGYSVPIADLEKALSQLLLTWTYERQRSTYLALLNGIGLHIISDHQLRSALTHYFDVDQTRLHQDYLTNYDLAQRRLRKGLGRHIRISPPAEFDSLSSLPDDFHVVRLYSTPDVMVTDIEFMNDLAEQGLRAFELVREIDRVRAANRALRDRVVQSIR